jgi:allantoinase
LVIWNPDAQLSVEPAHLHQRHKITPYARRKLSGLVEATFLRGRKIYERGEFGPSPLGQVLRRGRA